MTLLQILPVIILWAVVAVRLLGLRLGWKAGVLPAVSLVAMGATLNIDPVYLAVDRLLGSWNLLNLLVHLLMGMGMTELSRLLLKVTGRSGRHVTVLIGVGVALAVVQVALLVVSDTRGSAANFTETFGGTPTIALYQATFFGWFGIITAYTGVETLRRDRRGESRAFRIGFDLLSIGCMMGVLAAGMKMFHIGAKLLDADAGSHEVLITVYRLLLALMIVGFAAGFILPSCGRIQETLHARTRRAEDMAALQPIVERLAETPEGRRSMDAAAVSLDARTSRTQLYRWFILIGDIRVLDPGLLSLQENRIIDEIGTRIEHNNIPAQRSPAAGG